MSLARKEGSNGVLLLPIFIIDKDKLIFLENLWDRFESLNLPF